MEKTRCKFVCDSVSEQGDNEGGTIYTAELSAVVNGSEENESFFRWTPTGSLLLGCIRPGIFVEGQEYYLDISTAEPAAEEAAQ